MFLLETGLFRLAVGNQLQPAYPLDRRGNQTGSNQSRQPGEFFDKPFLPLSRFPPSLWIKLPTLARRGYLDSGLRSKPTVGVTKAPRFVIGQEHDCRPGAVIRQPSDYRARLDFIRQTICS
jgi:hypothetical protein